MTAKAFLKIRKNLYWVPRLTNRDRDVLLAEMAETSTMGQRAQKHVWNAVKGQGCSAELEGKANLPTMVLGPWTAIPTTQHTHKSGGWTTKLTNTE